MPFCCVKRCSKVRLNHEEQLFAKGREMLKNEIDIVLFVKKIRLLEAFLITKFDFNTESDSQAELKVIEVPLDNYDSTIVVQELVETSKIIETPR